LRAARAPESTASLAPAQRAWYAKENAASFVLVIEALSRALPDSAYLTELTLTGATLRMIGWTRDAPPLIAALDRSGHLADVHFAAPTTRGPDGQLFRFHIEARVEPRLDVTE
jgi:general secretion pathway protein L